MGSGWIVVLCVVVGVQLQSGFVSAGNESVSNEGELVMNYYRDSCPQAEDIIQEQVRLLYKRHKNTAFSWLRNIFHDCAVQSCDASLLLDSTRKSVSEKEMDRSFGLRNFGYLDSIKEAVERECPGVVSCADILVLSARDGIVSLGGPFIPLKTGRRDGRKSRADLLETYLPDHNDSISSVLSRFKAIGIDTPGVVALLGPLNYLPSEEAFKSGVYVLEIGGNDFSYGYMNLNLTPAQVKQTMLPRVARAVAGAVQALYDEGARTVLVKDVAPQGCGSFWLTYFSPTDFDQHGCSTSYNDAVLFYNRVLRAQLSKLRSKLSDASIIYVNTYDIVYDFFANPSKYGNVVEC